MNNLVHISQTEFIRNWGDFSGLLVLFIMPTGLLVAGIVVLLRKGWTSYWRVLEVALFILAAILYPVAIFMQLVIVNTRP